MFQRYDLVHNIPDMMEEDSCGDYYRVAEVRERVQDIIEELRETMLHIELNIDGEYAMYDVIDVLEELVR